MQDELFDEGVMRACARAAKKVTVVNKRYVDYGDVLQEMYVWVAKNVKYVHEWRGQDQHGMNKLGVALFRHGHGYVARERARRTGGSTSDFFYYTPAVIEELLPDVWSYSQWEASNQVEPDMPRGKSAPAEGGNRRAMMIDVAYSVGTLSADDQRLLRDRYWDHPAMPAGQLAAMWNLTEDGLRKKLDRVLAKLVDRLGGEPPMWRNSRKAVSNAAAQSKMRKDC